MKLKTAREIGSGVVRTHTAVRVRELATPFSMAVIMLGATACGPDQKTYDIGPLFPLSAGKCAKYHGEAQGSEPGASCYVTKQECENAAHDWDVTMSNVPDALRFSC